MGRCTEYQRKLGGKQAHHVGKCDPVEVIKFLIEDYFSLSWALRDRSFYDSSKHFSYSVGPIFTKSKRTHPINFVTVADPNQSRYLYLFRHLAHRYLQLSTAGIWCWSGGLGILKKKLSVLQYCVLLQWCTKIRAVLTGQLTVSGFDLAWFSSLSSKRLCVFGLNGTI